MQNPRSLFKKIILGIFAVVFMFATVFLAKTLPSSSSTISGPTDNTISKNELTALPHFVQPAGSVQLLIEPDNTTAPIISLINNAKNSVDVTMYQFDDSRLADTLIAAQKRGVAVRVLLNKGYKGQIDPKQLATKTYLEAGGVLVKYTPDYFALTHQKTISVDHRASLIMTFNWVSKYYSTGRDFGILDNDINDVNAIENTFDADWNAKKIDSQNGDDLLWSPGAESAMIMVIQSTTKTLDVYNEEMADDKITDALIAADKRGVDVRVTMTYSTNWKPAFIKLANAGVNLRTYANGKNHIYIHAKMILADGTYAYLGSQNFSFYSLEKNRELGIFITDPNVLSQLGKIFEQDYRGARVYIVPK
ncbi:MAG: cardiolipin synthase [Patescibacteria group bacterium]|nr:cardiolipin synthase [Patescibacteria group bacterium]